MLLKRFQVQGYKNFRQPVVLEALDRLNVIHGPNNVGKSNLLQSIALFFHLLSPRDGEASKIPISFAETISSEALAKAGFAPPRIFNLETQEPIEMLATLTAEAGELSALGIEEILPASRVEVGLRLHRVLDRLELRITRFCFADGRDLVKRDMSQEEHVYALRFALFLTRNFLVQTREAGQRFALIGLDRRIYPVTHEALGAESYAGVVPQKDMLALYDAKDSIEPAIYRRWELFTHVLQKFGDVLGEGTFQVLFERATQRASLVFQTPNVRIPIDLLGSGIQQVVAIVASLVMSRATLIGIEEPELNLRFDAQLRLREILLDIVSGAEGPRQIFLTSHSPAFEHGDCFYAMRPSPSGPKVERRPGAEATQFTQHNLAQEPITGGAAVGYVSSDGLVRIPEAIRNDLGLQGGGGIVLWKPQGAEHYQLLTNEQFLDAFQGPDHAGDE